MNEYFFGFSEISSKNYISFIISIFLILIPSYYLLRRLIFNYIKKRKIENLFSLDIDLQKEMDKFRKQSPTLIFHFIYPLTKCKIYKYIYFNSLKNGFKINEKDLIHYSKIMELVDDLIDESKWYSVCLKLEKFKYKKDLDESLGIIIDNLLNSIWKNISQPDKKKEIINDFKIQLRSCIILSLYYISPSYINLNNIRIELNRFVKGDYSIEQDKFWASGFVDYLLPKFILLIPEINIKDLIPLFALEKEVENDKDNESTESTKEVQKGLFF